MFRNLIQPQTNPQKVAFTGTAAASVAFESSTESVRVCSDVDCWIVFGASPVAVVTDIYLPAKVPQVFGVKGGDKVSAIGGGAGNLYVTEASSS